MITVNIQIKSSNLQKIKLKLSEQLHNKAGPLRDAFLQCDARYIGAMRQRFNIFSRGGGDWPPLKHSTILARTRKPLTRLNKDLEEGLITEEQYARRYAAAKKRVLKARQRIAAGAIVAILRDTGILFNVLSTDHTVPGRWFEFIDGGFRTGFGGSAIHPGSKTTIGEIAKFHQEGSGHLPQRKILVEPDEDVKNDMIDYLQRAVYRLINEI